MTEQNQDQASNENSENATKEDKQTSHASEVFSAVKDVIGKFGPEAKQAVVEEILKEKKAALVATLKKGIEKLGELRRTFDKENRPDQVAYDATGKKIETMSAAKFEAVKKAKEAVDKLDKAINLAVEKSDFSKLNELCK